MGSEKRNDGSRVTYTRVWWWVIRESGGPQANESNWWPNMLRIAGHGDGSSESAYVEGGTDFGLPGSLFNVQWGVVKGAPDVLIYHGAMNLSILNVRFEAWCV
jgi:hypothetical protein